MLAVFAGERHTHIARIALAFISAALIALAIGWADSIWGGGIGVILAAIAVPPAIAALVGPRNDYLWQLSLLSTVSIGVILVLLALMSLGAD